jgi:predicted small lipoprotein YifL
MSKYLVVAAVVALAACGEKKAEAPMADTTAAKMAAPAPAAMPDSMHKADSAKAAGDTAKKP